MEMETTNLQRLNHILAVSKKEYGLQRMTDNCRHERRAENTANFEFFKLNITCFGTTCWISPVANFPQMNVRSVRRNQIRLTTGKKQLDIKACTTVSIARFVPSYLERNDKPPLINPFDCWNHSHYPPSRVLPEAVDYIYFLPLDPAVFEPFELSGALPFDFWMALISAPKQPLLPAAIFFRSPLKLQSVLNVFKGL